MTMPAPRPELRPVADPPPGTPAGPYLSLLRAGLDHRWPPTAERFGEMCRYAVTPAGKLLRPTLLVEACAAVHGEVARVLPAALGTEAGHAASLVHDDIIDQDDLRRGRPTVHRRYGIDQAIVVGDALLFDLFRGLAECRAAGVPAERVAEALRIVAEAGIELCRGQLLEGELCGRLDCSVAEYDRMAVGKTGALFSGACAAGAVLGGGTPEQSEALAAYGRDLGLAFQIADDLLPFVSDADSVGKSDGSDLRNHRPTLPVIYAWQNAAPRVRRQLTSLFHEPAGENAMLLLHDIVVGTGAVERALHRADAVCHRAVGHLAGLDDTPSRARLAQLALAAARRHH